MEKFKRRSDYSFIQKDLVPLIRIEATILIHLLDFENTVKEISIIEGIPPATISFTLKRLKDYYKCRTLIKLVSILSHSGYIENLKEYYFIDEETKKVKFI